MATAKLRVSGPLLCTVLLRSGFDAEVVDAEVEADSRAIVFTLDRLDVPEGVVEIEPHYSRSPGLDPISISGVSYRYADGHWEHPEPIGTPT